jgi:hypothetical protein
MISLATQSGNLTKDIALCLTMRRRTGFLGIHEIFAKSCV